MNENNPSNRILTFDCYGTLLNLDSVDQALAQIARANQLDPQKACDYYSRYEDRLMYGETFRPFESLVREILSYVDFELSAQVFQTQAERILQAYREADPFEEVKESLAKLHAQGWTIVLMSNTYDSLMRHHLQKLGSSIDHVLLADQVHAYKPQLAFFEEAEKALNLKSNTHIHIAAGYWWDMIPAGKMRWPAIWVDRKNHALYARRKMALKKFAPFVSFPAFWKPSVRTQQFARRQRFEFISFEHSSCPF